MTSDARPATKDLRRSVPFRLTRADDGATGDGLTLDGYAAVFDSPTVIDSWEGTFVESIAHGAFRKSIRETTPRLQFDHGFHPLIGSIPIGRISTLAEDDQGLHVTARLSDNWLVEPVRDAIAEGAIDGMSFRFTVVREEWRDSAGKLLRPEEVETLLWQPGDRGPLERTHKELKVPELGPVVWPAYEATTVGVRSSTVTIDLSRINSDRAQRQALARAVFAAEAAQRATPDPVGPTGPAETPKAPETEGTTETTDAPPPEGHPAEAPDVDAPPPTDQAGEHAAGQHDQSDQSDPHDDAPSLEGHPSTTTQETDDVDRARTRAGETFLHNALAEIRAARRLTLKEIP